MTTWLVPVTIIEHGRVAVVEAATRTEAIRKARRADWLKCTEVKAYTITWAGKVEKAALHPEQEQP